MNSFRCLTRLSQLVVCAALQFGAALALGAVAHAQTAAPPPAEPSPSVAWPVTLDGQYRSRGQVNSGRDFTGDKWLDNEWASHRARLGVTAGLKDHAQVILRIQDSRVWGEEADTLAGSSAALDFHEAHAIVPLGSTGLTLKAGRQEVTLDSQRLVGNLDWVQRARSFDGARLRYTGHGLDASLLALQVAERDALDLDGHVPAGRTGDVYLIGGHARYTLSADHRASVVWLARKTDDAAPAKNELRHTVGAYAEGKGAGVTYHAEGYYQMGHQGAGDIAAWLGAVRASYKLPMALPVTVGGWAEALSGDGNATTAFDTLYATNHKYYGEMDFFLNVPKHTAQRGLQDFAGSLACTPVAGLTASADVHLFRTHDLAGDALTAAAGVQPAADLGQELDVRVQWKPLPGLGVHLLYGLFVPGAGMRALRKIPEATPLSHEQFGALTLDLWF